MYAPPEARQLAEDVFRAIARCRFVTVASLMAYAGPQGLTLDLVWAWCAAGLLQLGSATLDPITAAPVSYVALTPTGARALHASTGEHVEAVSPQRSKRSAAKRAHDVLVGEFALSVISLAADGAIELLGIETDDRKLATSVVIASPGAAPERIPLQPDGYALVRGPSGPVGLLVELDRGTTAPKRLASKFRGYLAWQRDGGPLRDFSVRAMRVLTIVPDERRLKKLHDVALAENAGRRSGFLAFALQDEMSVVTAERLLDPSCLPLGASSDGAVPILPRRPERLPMAA